MDDSTNNTNIVSFTIDDIVPISNTENNTINLLHENFIETEKNNMEGYTLNENKLEITSLNIPEHESKKMVLLNFEDDTFRAVIKLPDEKINLINSWYDKSKQQFDIEDIYRCSRNHYKK